MKALDTSEARHMLAPVSALRGKQACPTVLTAIQLARQHSLSV